MAKAVAGQSPVRQAVRNLDMDFSDAMRAVLNGKRISRREWNTTEAFVALTDGFLKIHHVDGRVDALLVRDADMREGDWFVIREN